MFYEPKSISLDNISVDQTERIVIWRSFIRHIVLRYWDLIVSYAICTQATFITYNSKSTQIEIFHSWNLLLVLKSKEIWYVDFALLILDHDIMLILIFLLSFVCLSLLLAFAFNFFRRIIILLFFSVFLIFFLSLFYSLRHTLK